MTRSAEMSNPQVRGIVGALALVSSTTVAVHELLVAVIVASAEEVIGWQVG
jgi:hypothetical protein